MRTPATTRKFFASALFACALTVIPALGTAVASAAPVGSHVSHALDHTGSSAGGHGNSHSGPAGGRSSGGPRPGAIDGRRVADRGWAPNGSTDNRRVGDRIVESGTTEGRRVADRDYFPVGPPLINSHGGQRTCWPLVVNCPAF
ncbi:hypothetical protein [Nocardia sp. NBC_01327]|uniref:hypothetical protein n=1 Tax=Nocardia sp. NBC_01327 TaxID=2903593 RepID=UPI002E1552A4|nr:hypothetical protein OG326_41960 [Nocardia sp. NBC_01327]